MCASKFRWRVVVNFARDGALCGARRALSARGGRANIPSAAAAARVLASSITEPHLLFKLKRTYCRT